MLELGIGADLLRGVGWVLRVVFAGLIVLALWRGRTWQLKVFYVVVILLTFISPLLPEIAKKREYQKKYAKAKALFDERCKTAGETVYKTVDEVEGVLLLNVRPRASDSNRNDPNWANAGIPNEPGDEDYITNFLTWEDRKDERNPRGILNQTPSDFPGYRYVDAKGSNGSMLRYTLKKVGELGYPFLAKADLNGPPARYAVSYANVGQPGDREHWVAGTTVAVIDTQTSEVLAKATWYSFVPSLNTGNGQSTPWAYSVSCPELTGKSYAPTRFFVDQVLKPKKGE